MSDYKASKITQEIWSSQENVSLIFAGGAADFALNPESHWLFYTMELPNNPQQRFIDTIQYTKRMQLMDGDHVKQFAEKIRAIHTKVESSRSDDEGKKMRMSNNAFKEVGDIIIDYAIRGWEYINRKQMSADDKESWYQDSRYIYAAMGVEDLPKDYKSWAKYREQSIKTRLVPNDYTDRMYQAYRNDLGFVRYWILRKMQAEFVHPLIKQKLGLKPNLIFRIGYRLYPYIPTQLDWKLIIFFMLKPEVRRKLSKY